MPAVVSGGHGRTWVPCGGAAAMLAEDEARRTRQERQMTVDRNDIETPADERNAKRGDREHVALPTRHPGAGDTPCVTLLDMESNFGMARG